MFLIIGLLLILFGFVISILEKQIQKNKENFTQALITNTKKTEDGYDIYLSYLSGENKEPCEIVISTKQNITKEYALLSETDDGFKIYDGKKKALLASLLCWILGIIILLI